MIRLIIAILLLFSLFLLVRKRQKTGGANRQSEESATVTAAEADPTSTGRYRVQKMLEKQAAQQKTGAHDPNAEDETLPDPFITAGPSTNPSQTKK